jgi:multiple sugar transport system permease protein
MRPARTLLFHGVSAALAIAFLFPLLWALLSSLKTTAEANQQPPTWFPHSLSLDNYRSLTTFDEGISTYLVNSVVVAGLTVAGSVVARTCCSWRRSRS